MLIIETLCSLTISLYEKDLLIYLLSHVATGCEEVFFDLKHFYISKSFDAQCTF